MIQNYQDKKNIQDDVLSEHLNSLFQGVLKAIE
jgi:hypothetical protein